MIVNVWLMYKAGEDRTYTSSKQPDPATLEIYRSNGFQVFRAEVNLPVDEGTVVLEAPASLVPPVPVVASSSVD